MIAGHNIDQKVAAILTSLHRCTGTEDPFRVVFYTTCCITSACFWSVALLLGVLEHRGSALSLHPRYS